MNERYYPCDSGNCPFSAEGGNACRDNCGMGVDESENIEYIEQEVKELYDRIEEEASWFSYDERVIIKSH